MNTEDILLIYHTPTNLSDLSLGATSIMKPSLLTSFTSTSRTGLSALSQDPPHCWFVHIYYYHLWGPSRQGPDISQTKA